MSFAEVVDVILLQINGGSLSIDSAVQRPEIEEYFPTAMSNAWLLLAKQTGAKRGALAMSNAFAEIYGSFDLQTTQEGSLRYVSLPGVVVDYSGVPLVADVIVGNCRHIRVSTKSILITAMFDAFWPLNSTNEEGDDVTRLYLKCAQPPKSVYVSAALLPSASRPDEKVMAPDGVIQVAIDEVVTKFRPQRQMPNDTAADLSDVNSVPK